MSTTTQTMTRPAARPVRWIAFLLALVAFALITTAVVRIATEAGPSAEPTSIAPDAGPSAIQPTVSRGDADPKRDPADAGNGGIGSHQRRAP